MGFRGIPFFKEVREQSTVREAVRRHGFAEPYVGPSQANDVLVFNHPDWTTTSPNLRVLLAAWSPEMLRLEAKINPHISRLTPGSDLCIARADDLKAKAILLDELRRRVISDPRLVALGANATGLRKPTLPSAICAAKFERDLGPEQRPHVSAAYFADVIDAIVPLVNDALASRKA